MNAFTFFIPLLSTASFYNFCNIFIGNFLKHHTHSGTS